MQNKLRKALLLLLLISIMCPVQIFASNGAIVNVGVTEISDIKQSVKLDITITNNPGISSFDIQINFNKDYFNLDESMGNGDGCEMSTAFTSGIKQCAVNDSGCRVIWSNIKDISADGTMFSLYLKPYDDIPVGDYTISISYNQKNTVNANNIAVILSTEAGVIHVKEPNPCFICDSAEVLQGDSFKYSISIKDNPGIAGYRIMLSYDKDVFSPEKNGGDIIVSLGEAFQSGTCYAVETDYGCQFLWLNVENIESNGELLSIMFSLSEDASPKDYEIALNYSIQDTLNEKGEVQTFTTQDGVVTCLKKNYVLTAIKHFDGNNYTFTVSAPNLPKSCPEFLYIVIAAYDKSSGKQLTVDLQVVAAGQLVSEGIKITLAKLYGINEDNIRWKVFAVRDSFNPISSVAEVD